MTKHQIGLAILEVMGFFVMFLFVYADLQATSYYSPSNGDLKVAGFVATAGMLFLNFLGLGVWLLFS